MWCGMTERYQPLRSTVTICCPVCRSRRAVESRGVRTTHVTTVEMCCNREHMRQYIQMLLAAYRAVWGAEWEQEEPQFRAAVERAGMLCDEVAEAMQQ